MIATNKSFTSEVLHDWMYVYVCVCRSVFLARQLVSVSVSVGVGSQDSRDFVFNWHGVGLADVHSVLFCLQLFVVALVFLVVFSLAVARRGVAGQSRRRRHRGRSGVAETCGL